MSVPDTPGPPETGAQFTAVLGRNWLIAIGISVFIFMRSSPTATAGNARVPGCPETNAKLVHFEPASP